MRFAFGLPLGVACALVAATSPIRAASCPPNVPPGVCAQRSPTVTPRPPVPRHLPAGSVAQQQQQQQTQASGARKQHLPPGSRAVPGVPPNPFQQGPVTSGAGAQTSGAKLHRPAGSNTAFVPKVPPNPFESGVSSGATAGTTSGPPPSTVPQRGPTQANPSGAVYSPTATTYRPQQPGVIPVHSGAARSPGVVAPPVQPSPSAAQPSPSNTQLSTPSLAPPAGASEYTITCWIDSTHYCQFPNPWQPPPRTVCSCGQLQGLTQ
jgi:hypothetical protein